MFPREKTRLKWCLPTLHKLSPRPGCFSHPTCSIKPSPLEQRVSLSLLVLTHVVGTVYAGEAGRQTSHHNAEFSPLYIYVCARLECGYSVYACTHECSVRKAYSSRYVTFAFARTSWAPETEENISCTEDGTKALRKTLGYVSTSLTSWWQFFSTNSAFCAAVLPIWKILQSPGDLIWKL